MEKISAEIAAAEEASRRRMAEREKEATDQGEPDAAASGLEEGEKNVGLAPGGTAQQDSPSEGSDKEGEETETNPVDAGGEAFRPFSESSAALEYLSPFLFVSFRVSSSWQLTVFPSFAPARMLIFFYDVLLPDASFCPETEKSKALEEPEACSGSTEGASEDKESVPEGAMEEGTSDSNTGSETTSALTEDAPPSEPASEGPSRGRSAAH